MKTKIEFLLELHCKKEEIQAEEVYVRVLAFTAMTAGYVQRYTPNLELLELYLADL